MCGRRPVRSHRCASGSRCGRGNGCAAARRVAWAARRQVVPHQGAPPRVRQHEQDAGLLRVRAVRVCARAARHEDPRRPAAGDGASASCAQSGQAHHAAQRRRVVDAGGFFFVRRIYGLRVSVATSRRISGIIVVCATHARGREGLLRGRSVRRLRRSKKQAAPHQHARHQRGRLAHRAHQHGDRPRGHDDTAARHRHLSDARRERAEAAQTARTNARRQLREEVDDAGSWRDWRAQDVRQRGQEAAAAARAGGGWRRRNPEEQQQQQRARSVA